MTIILIILAIALTLINKKIPNPKVKGFMSLIIMFLEVSAMILVLSFIISGKFI